MVVPCGMRVDTSLWTPWFMDRRLADAARKTRLDVTTPYHETTSLTFDLTSLQHAFEFVPRLKN
ncbi:hypothetical protein KGM_208469 [Danaus plexippus plexippus]|uniref:Uncharacterized protein n=1 Tax=Danaus plexippus plexippus TaxID=278856 RepID=A0A212EJC7_DANPL|nr:hypothetical protein KGM_208469 [Danaus plexippus plexippus]